MRNRIDKQNKYSSIVMSLKKGLFMLLFSCALLVTVFSVNTTYLFAFDDDGWMTYEEVKVEAYCVLDGSTGQVIFEKNADERRANASTTKIMTALTLVDDENYDPHRMLRVSQQAITLGDPNSARIKGLKAGDEISTLDSLAALLIASANDVARVIAQNYGGAYGAIDPRGENDPQRSEMLFVEKMNKHMAQLGLNDTHFTNPAGFDMQDRSHFTTARDLAYISLAAMKNQQIAHIVGLQRYRLPPSESHRDAFWASMSNSNGLIAYGADLLDSKYFARYTGIKTGTTPQAGKCLVGSGETHDGKLIICVALGITLPSAHIDNPWYARALPVRALLEEGARRIGSPAIDRQVNLLVPTVNTLPTHPTEPSSSGEDVIPADTDHDPSHVNPGANVSEPKVSGNTGTGIIASVRGLPIVLKILMVIGLLAIIFMVIRLIILIRSWGKSHDHRRKSTDYRRREDRRESYVRREQTMAAERGASDQYRPRVNDSQRFEQRERPPISHDHDDERSRDRQRSPRGRVVPSPGHRSAQVRDPFNARQPREGQNHFRPPNRRD